MAQVYNVVPYLQRKLLCTYDKGKRLNHHDMVDLSSRLNRFIVQEQNRINRPDSEL
ncbi:hypothetical protein LLE49_12790 [Alicyclobacillus tolerans]|uniref:hypothetical protein n=1 Tax=Alicyclobacillus tolerans TaxID=90970 RepID=UPI001F3C1B1E|nr:hypothetical protein [Alicyclobacillus tolerans]MCF8565595.1 hypothetical protein [Alicyclobacillus tolerans]